MNKKFQLLLTTTLTITVNWIWANNKELLMLADCHFIGNVWDYLGIWRGNPRPFNDRDESAACFYHAINLPKA